MARDQSQAKGGNQDEDLVQWKGLCWFTSNGRTLGRVVGHVPQEPEQDLFWRETDTERFAFRRADRAHSRNRTGM
jgi:hypothetical protein